MTNIPVSSNLPQITYSMLVGPPDVELFAPILQHQLRVLGRHFCHKLIVVDDLPRGNSTPAAMRALKAKADELVAAGVIDQAVSLRAFHRTQSAVLRQHFGRKPFWKRDFRAIPLAGWVAALESGSTDWHFHSDSDILLYFDDTEAWLAHAVQLLQAHASNVICAPHPGPPSDHPLSGQAEPYTRDAEGNLYFEGFSSRRFLMYKPHMRQMLPLRLQWINSRRIILKHLLQGKSPLYNWELLISSRQRELKRHRVHPPAEVGWSLHADDHGELFMRLLPHLIASVERAEWPTAQLGKYDIVLPAWATHLGM